MSSRLVLRSAVAIVLPAALSACLAGPSTALGGGPIGRAPDLREASLLPEPDSTRGVGFIIRSNRRDLLEQARVDLNAGARAYERLMGERPHEGDIQLVSDAREVRITIRMSGQEIAPFSVSLQRDERGRARVPESMRIAAAADLAMARAWLTAAAQRLAPEGRASDGWMARGQMPAWLRVGLLQAVGGHRLHDLWLAQLARQRDSLPPLAELFGDEACGAACLAPLMGDGDASRSATERGADDVPSGQRPRRGRLPLLEGRARHVAMSFSVVQFMSRREGPDFMRALVTAALTNGDVQPVLARARSFTADPSDIERQWRVWLAPFADPVR